MARTSLLATRAVAAGRVRRWLFAVLLVLMLAGMAPPPPVVFARTAEDAFRLGCSELAPGTTVECHVVQSEPEPPWVRVILRSWQPAGESVLLDDPSPEWEDHEIWFSFELPGNAQGGDEVLVMLRNAADGQVGDFVLPVAGAEPSEPEPAELEPTPTGDPTEDTAERASDRDPNPDDRGDDTAVDATVDADAPAVEPSEEELPLTGPIALPFALAVTLLAGGSILLVRGRLIR